jgi:outer membrane protein TolC
MLGASLWGGRLFGQDQGAAPPPRVISPEEAVSLAFKNNLTLESTQASTGIKKRASSWSWNQFIPSLTVAGSLSRDNEAGKIAGMQPVDIASVLPAGLAPIPPGTLYGVVPYSLDAPQWHVAGSIQASLSINIAMFENMRRLRLDYEGGLIAYEKAKVQLERDVRKSYYSMLLLRENIALLRENFETAGRRVEMARANYRAGLAPELTLLQAQVSQENLKPVIDQAENGLKLAMAQFALQLGLPYDTPFELIPITGETAFISLDVADLIAQAASEKPDVHALRQNILLLQSARRAQLYALTPTLSLSWNHTSAFIKDPWKDSWFDSRDDWQRSGALTLSLSIRLHSLIPFSPDFQAVWDLDDQIRIANTGLAQMIQGTEIEIYNTVLSLEKTRITAEAQEQTVNLAERTYRLTETAYRSGLQDLLEVQNAELSLRQARLQMLEQQFNYRTGLIDLEYAIGVPFGTLSSRSN